MSAPIVRDENVLPTITEQQLDRLEATVREGAKAFIVVGTALMKIRDQRGYKLRGYKTFQEYCEKEFGISDRHGRRLIEASATAKTVEKIFGEAPANEAVAREFAPIVGDPKLLERVKAKLSSAKKTLGTATAERVADAVRAVTHKNGDGARHKEKSPEPPPTFTDICPNCQTVPDHYGHTALGWSCDNCAAAVFVGVVSAAAPRACVECGAPIVGDTGFCQNCGVRL